VPPGAWVLAVAIGLGDARGAAHGASPIPIDLSLHYRYPVTQVIDGDTIIIRCDVRGVLMQLRGIKAERPGAKRFLQELLGGEAVHLVYAPQGPSDRAGHLAAYLFRVRDRLFVNQEVLDQGFGALNDDDGPHEHLFRVIEEDARTEGRGLWSQGDLRTRREPSTRAQEQWASTIERRNNLHQRWRNWNNAVEIAAIEQEAASELGTSVLTVQNNRKEKVRVILRGPLRPVSIVVPAGTSRSVHLINGNRYQVYLRFGDEPRALYQGDAILVDNNNPTLTLATEHNGNYAVRKVQ
jgi:endonuclease YncB( thermonuclease family)